MVICHRSEVGNYRPISLLLLVSKALERVVNNSLINHVVSNGLISDWQFEFRSGSSTQEAVLAATLD